MQEVDDAGQLVLGSDREVDGDALRAELRAKLVERSEEVRAFAVEHVHEDDACKPEVFRAVPVARGLHLDAHDAADRDERALDDVQRGDRVTLEARLAGRVDEVDLAALPLDVRERVRDRHLALLLVLVPVGDRRSLLDDAQPIRRTRLEEHRLDERGLSCAAVTDDGDVADLSGLDCGHASAPPGWFARDLSEARLGIPRVTLPVHEVAAHRDPFSALRSQRGGGRARLD